MSFEYDKIVMTKNNVFMGKGFCNQGLFVLSISKVMNGNSSSAYLVDSYNVWHVRLRYASGGYIKKMQSLSLINNIDYSGLSKCQICATSKLTKRTCGSVSRETKLLELIHYVLGDSKQTMTRLPEQHSPMPPLDLQLLPHQQAKKCFKTLDPFLLEDNI